MKELEKGKNGTRVFASRIFYSEEVRKAALQEYLLGDKSRSEIAMKYGIVNGTLLSHWKRRALNDPMYVIPERKKEHQTYTRRVMELAVRDYNKGVPLEDIGKRYSIGNLLLISNWSRIFASANRQRKRIGMKTTIPESLFKSEKELSQAKLIEELKKKLSAAEDSLAMSEVALAESNLRYKASKQLIDLAENSYGIDIRKNSGSK